MKNTILLLLTFLLFTACNVSLEPEFKKITNIYPKKVTVSIIEVEANAVFYNPNDVGCTVKDVDITVFVNGVSAGKAKQTQPISIDSKGDFIVPLSTTFSPLELLDNKMDILNGSIGKLLNNEMEIQYLGSVTLEKVGLSYAFEIDETQNIKLQKK